ncbi:thioredoxin family protein [Eudoraea chungangensis]|uniref:thioredoxin family protein n=1 Tax=Eudoraea chungangensis TaxID=1481905 RepID=UPI0023ED6E45|nr:thioredoxin family protein [Eudoraea chungangensis]
MFFICVFSWAQDWQTDFNKARELAAEENKPIILVFQGSDWCAPCIKLDRDIWQDEDFIKYAKKNYIMLLADFPRRKKNKLSAVQQLRNNKLAEIYNKDGNFPLVVILDQKGDVFGKTAYKKSSPEDYISLINSFLQ